MSETTKPTPSEFHAVSCSGASNAGEYADKVTRALDAAGIVNMNCLTKIAVNDTVLIGKYAAAPDKAIAIDGCPVHCAKKILEAAGVRGFTHAVMTDMGVKKGETPVTQEKVDGITIRIREQLDTVMLLHLGGQR